MKTILRQKDPSRPPAPVAIEETPLISDISIDRLLDDGLLALQREMKNLLRLSANGKLEGPDARDLRDTVKLLFELKDRENALLKGMTDEQLRELANGK